MINCLFIAVAMGQQTCLERAHSHNDYLRPHPLADALEQKFASVEVDVFLRDGRLYVAHTKAEIDPNKTLENQYLMPLSKRLRENRGKIYPGYGGTFWVLVDIKENGAAAYEEFKRLMDRFIELQWQFVRPAVRFVISGDRPIEAIKRDEGKFAAIDGRWNDLDSNCSVELMPWISESWQTHFVWRGSGELSENDAAKLKEMVQNVHAQKRKLRFWATPDSEAGWITCWSAGVDFLNTDRPVDLAKWMRMQVP